MKKLLAVTLAVVMALAMLTACGGETAEETFKMDISPYDQLNFDDYVKLPDYTQYKLEVPEVSVTDEEVEKEIDNRLAAASEETEEITEGKVEKGDTVTISFKGTLKDGSSPEGMNSDSYTLTLGEASMIDGFQEGLYGATIGEPVTLELKFPDPYSMNEELSGQDVTFEVTVLSKTQKIEAEYNEEFMKKDSGDAASNEEEYKAYIKETLLKSKQEEADYSAKTAIYQQIVGDTEITAYPEEEVAAQIEKLTTQYKDYAAANNKEWEDFVKELFKSEEDFNTAVDEYVRQAIKTKLTIYALCSKEGITVTDEEFTERVKQYLEAMQVESAEAFEQNAGMSIVDYLNMQEVPANMYLDKFLDTVYGDGAKAES